MIRRAIRFLCVLILISLAAPPPARAQDEVSWLLGQINGLRASLGLPPYALNPQLSAAATQHSQVMAAGCVISHTESNGSTPVSRAQANGYTGNFVSENIYGGGIATAANAWNFWINSPVHYAGLTHGVVNEVGIGIASGLCNTYTLLFGHRGDVTAPPAPAANPGAGDAPPPAQRPYVPPPPTRTPTPTIPTLTPSATWTLTPTYTPSATHTPLSPTPTPLLLPTVAAPGQSATPTAVAQAALPTETPSPPPSPTMVPPTPTPLVVNHPAAHEDGFEARDLVPFALAGQIVLITLVGIVYFRRQR